MSTKVVMLGTGTPNPDPRRSGPSLAVVVDDQAYLVDCGVGVVRRAVEAYQNGIEALKPERLSKCFITHLHSDHTLGLADLILTPWVLERDRPLELIAPKGTIEMVGYLKKAYHLDIAERIGGHEGNAVGSQVEIKEIEADGVVYQDELVTVEAITVVHGTFEGAFAFRFTTADGVIVVSGDTFPYDPFIEKAKGCDILVHEVYHAEGLKKREAYWQRYHSSVHTSSKELGIVASKIQPKLMVLYHQLYMMDINTYTEDLYEKTAAIDELMLQDIRENYDGKVIGANDLDVFTLG